MVLTARKIAVTVNSRQYQGISVPSNKKSRTVFIAQYGTDVFCSGIKRKKPFAKADGFFQLNPPAAEEIHLRWMKSLCDEICLAAGDGGGFNFI